jgi:hypothetical protein
VDLVPPWTKNPQAHLRKASAAQCTGRSLGKVDHPARDEGAAVVDADYDASARALIDDGDLGAEGQRLVSGGDGLRPESLAIRGDFSGGVVGGDAALGEGGGICAGAKGRQSEANEGSASHPLPFSDCCEEDSTDAISGKFEEFVNLSGK